MKRLLLLPYFTTTLVVYTASVLYHLPVMYELDASHWARRLAYDLTYHNPLTAAWWYAITITGLVVALAAKEW